MVKDEHQTNASFYLAIVIIPCTNVFFTIKAMIGEHQVQLAVNRTSIMHSDCHLQGKQFAAHSDIDSVFRLSLLKLVHKSVCIRYIHTLTDA